MEIYSDTVFRYPVRAVVFDFDGTISTLRCGWEEVMRPLMLEKISLGDAANAGEALEKEVEDYIDQSTGIQTIFQMKWLSERVAAAGGPLVDPWEYKAEYNRRLMKKIENTRQKLEAGDLPSEERLIAGSKAFLEALRQRDIVLYAASGTDDPDVRREAAALGVAQYFTEIAGAPLGEENCSKEKVLKRLVEQSGYSGEALAVIGDGKVEIALGKKYGTRALGVASEEEKRRGINPKKRERLIRAGADAIVGDFLEVEGICAWLGL